MTPLSPRLHLLFKETKTVCFGRFVIDVPATATLVFGPAEVGPYISFLPGQGGEIARHLARNLVEVETNREYLDKDGTARLPLFGKVIDGTVPGQKIVLDSKNGVGYYVNSYVPLGKDLFVLHFSNVVHENFSVDAFNTIANQLRLRANDEIPTEPGTCIDGGFLPMALEYERVRIGVRLKEFPDIHLSVDVHKNRDMLAESGRLELMLEQGEELAKQQGHGPAYARIKTFRRGVRRLGPWKGFEIVARKPAYKDDVDAHEFRFQSLGAIHDPLQPQLDVRLDSGVKNNRAARIKPSLTDEEAVALWDKLIETIRVRPVNGENAGSVATPKTPLASLVATGGTCPESGWWQCTEGDNVEGGRRRHFTEGESMPHAILLGPPTLWQRLTGDRPKHRTATVWRLVDYDESPAGPSFAAAGGTAPPIAMEQRFSSPNEHSAKNARPSDD